MAVTSITLPFADGEYNFRLTIAGINEIQAKCGCGIGKVWRRLHASRLNFMGEDSGVPQEADFYLADIVEPIRQGLIGGSGGLVDGQSIAINLMLASRLIDNYVLNQPLADSWSRAYAIVDALVAGYDPPVKKKDEESEVKKDGSTTQEP